jgi:hypothetical protein
MTPATWLLDLSGQVPPTVSLYGIDIESRFFPSSPAPNIRLSTDSVTKLPADWSSTVTLVHQRSLAVALPLPEFPVALKEIYRVLAPEGWFNSLETLLDVSQWSWTPGPATTKLFKLAGAVFQTRGLAPDLPLRLPALLEEAWFVNIHTERRTFNLHGPDGALWMDNGLRALQPLKKPVLAAGGLGFVKSEEEYDALMDAAKNELLGSPQVSDIFLVYTQKPLPPS